MASSFIWDQCQLDNSIAASLTTLNELLHPESVSNSTTHDSIGATTLKNGSLLDSKASSTAVEVPLLGSQKSALTDAEHSCKVFLEELDALLTLLTGISNSHVDVTGRTNNLILSCENLLEQQVNKI